MRRRWGTGAILALCASLLASIGAAAPALAHPGAVSVFQIGVGVVTPIPVLVPADYGKAIVRIEIASAPGFAFSSAVAPGPWQATLAGQTVSFTGGTIPANDPGVVFTLRGTAERKGQLIFPVTTFSPDGTVMRYIGGPTDRNAGVVVYAGVSPAIPHRRGVPWRTIAGGVIVGFGTIGTGALLLLRRRRAYSSAA